VPGAGAAPGRRARAVWLAGVVLLAATAERSAAELWAERITAESAAFRRVGGPDAIAGVGDFALGNGTVCAAVSDPAHESVLSPAGGVLVDLGHCGRADDHFVQLQPLFNMSRHQVPPVMEIRGEVAGGEARIVTTGTFDGLRFETVYALDESRPRALRIRSRVWRDGDGAALRLFGDVALHGVGSLRAFTANLARPARSDGFAHPEVDHDRLLSMLSGIRAADLQVLVGGDRPSPGIAYGLRSEVVRVEGGEGATDLPHLAVNGISFSLLGALVDSVLGGDGEIGLLQLAQVPFMDLADDATLTYERSVLVGERADVASVTDLLWPDAPRVAGRVDDAAARVRISLADGAPVTEARPDSDGRFSLRLPAGGYALVAATPDGRELRRPLVVEAADVELEPLALAPPARVTLPRGSPMRLVFRGLDGTPDPRLRSDGLELRFGAEPAHASRDSSDVSLAGLADDPAELTLAPGRYRVLATRGPEYEVRELAIETRPGEAVALEIPPLARAIETPGWIAADLHVHAEPSDDSTLPLSERVASFVAQGGEVLVATDHDRVTDYAPLLRELGLASEIASLSGVEITSTVHGAANPETSGHANVFPLAPDPLAYRDGTPAHEGRRLRDLVARIRALGGQRLVQLNHPRGREGERGDLNYFTHLAVADEGFDPTRPLAHERNRALVEPDAASGLRDLDFDVIELLNGERLAGYRLVRADWLSLLLQGEFRAATANSDSHGARQLVALPRTYVRVADDRPAALDAPALLAAVRAGRSTGSTGPFLEAELGGAGPGERFAGASGELRVRVHAAPWVPVSRARVYVNGALAAGGAIHAGEEARYALAFAGDAFVTVEVEGDAGDVYSAVAPGFTPFAFTNPIFVDADGDGAWTAPGLPAEPPPALARPLEG
jgi:hypothetical protein